MTNPKELPDFPGGPGASGCRGRFGLINHPAGKETMEEEYFDQVLDNIFIPDNPPTMVLIVGPCRTGTTALGNVFARTGYDAYMQPIKSMRRALVEGEIVEWQIQPNSFATSKETLGPEHEAEFFDPVRALLKVGYPKEKVIFIPILREPEATLTSWVRMWGSASVADFIRTYQMTDEIREEAEAEGIPDFRKINKFLYLTLIFGRY